MISTLKEQRDVNNNKRRDEFGLPNIDKEKFNSVFPNIGKVSREKERKPFGGVSRDYLMQRGQELKDQGYGRDEVKKFLQQEIKGNRLNAALGKKPEKQIGSFNQEGKFVRDRSPNPGNEVKARNNDVFGVPPTIDPDSESQVTSINEDQGLSVRDMFELNAAQYEESDPETANKFKALNNDYGELQQSFNNIVNGFSVLEELGNERMNEIGLMSSELGKRLTDDLLESKEYFMSKYGEEGELRKQMDESYKMRAQLIKDARGEAGARAVSQAAGAGLSANAQARARAKAEREYWNDLAQLEEQKIKDYDNMYTKVQNFMGAFRNELGETTDNYLIQTYKDMNAWKNGIGEALLNSVNSLEQARINLQLQREANEASSGSGSTGQSGNVSPEAQSQVASGEQVTGPIQAVNEDGRLQDPNGDIPYEGWIIVDGQNYTISIVDGQPVLRGAGGSQNITKEQSEALLRTYGVNL